MKRYKIGSHLDEYKKKVVARERGQFNYPDRAWRKRWLPLIKYDHDWDGEYLIMVMAFKLHIMLDFFSHRDNFVLSEESRMKIVEQLEKACELADKVVDDDFYKGAYDYLEAHIKRNEVKTDFGTGYEGVWDSPESEAEYHRLSKEAQEERKRTIREFFDFVRDNYENWWD